MFHQIYELMVLGMHPAIPHPRRSQIRPPTVEISLDSAPDAPARHPLSYHRSPRASSTRLTNSARYPSGSSPLNIRPRAAAEAKLPLPACFDFRSTMPNSATADAKPMFAPIGCGWTCITLETRRLVSPSGALYLSFTV